MTLRPLWGLVALSLVLNVVILGLVLRPGKTVADPAPDRKTPAAEKIEASEIVLRRPGGKPALKFRAGADGAAWIEFLTPDGSPVLTLSHVRQTPRLTLDTPEAVSYFKLEGSASGVAEIRFPDRDYHDRVLIRGPVRPTVEVAK